MRAAKLLNRAVRRALSVAVATRSGSPEVSSAAFCAQPPDLRFASLDGYGLRNKLPAGPYRLWVRLHLAEHTREGSE